MQRIAVILKGNLGKKEKLKREILDRQPNGFETVFYTTEGMGDAIRLAEKAINEGARYLISVGGDGMLNEVVNGFMNSDLNSRGEVAIGLLPNGTGNDFSKTIGVYNSNTELLYDLIQRDSVKKIDVGKVKYVSLEKKNMTRYFINITDIGIGGHVVQKMNMGGTFINASMTYTKAIIQSFLSFKHVPVKITADTFEWEGKILSLCLANGKYFGSGLCIAPQADLFDGQIQLVILGNVSLWDYVRSMSKVRRGEMMDHPEVIYKKVNSCTIEARADELPIDMDGEYIGHTPIQMEVLPAALKFLM